MKSKYNYLTEDEAKNFSRQQANIQIAMGLQNCKTKKEVCELLDDIRQHEKILVFREVLLKTEKIEKKIQEIEKDVSQKFPREKIDYIR